MTQQLLALVLSAMGLVAPTPAEAGQSGNGRQASARTRDVYVSVLDSSGKAVPGLTAADFTVREDGAVREVLKAGPATAPLTVSVVIDDSQAAEPAIQDLREGLTAFVKRLDGKAELALATIGERPTALLDYTGSTEQLTKAVNRLFARPGSGAYLLDGLVDVARGLAKREAPRKAIVVLTLESGPEFSNRYYETVLEELQKSGATLHVLAIGSPASSLDDEMRNRNMVLAEGTVRSGGRRDQLLSMRAIPEKLRQLADELTNQYEVTYSRPETLIPPEKLDVSIQKSGLTVRAPKRAER
jgi:VWFA-related protein